MAKGRGQQAAAATELELDAEVVTKSAINEKDELAGAQTAGDYIHIRS